MGIMGEFAKQDIYDGEDAFDENLDLKQTQAMNQ
jgi:hypothetical protein